MNFLTICQRANTLAGLQGTISSVSLVSGYQDTLIKYVSQAYIDIQNFRDEWMFMKTYVNISLTAGEYSYSPSSDTVKKWDIKNILYDSTPLWPVSYDYWEQTKQSEASQAQPGLVAIDHSNNKLYFNPVNGSYTIKAYYWQVPDVMTGNTDTPILPDGYEYLIIYRGVADFAAFIGNGNLYQIYSQKADTLLGDLLRSNNPSKRINLKGRTI